MSILVIAEHDNKNLKGATLNTLNAATQIGDEIHLLVAGHETNNVVEESQSLNGVTKIINVDNELYKNSLAEEVEKLVISIAADYSYILAPATTFGKNLMPRIAAKMDTQQISDIISVESSDTFKRPIYAGSCIATVKSSDEKKVITVRSTAFDPVEKANSNIPVDTLSAIDACGVSEFVSEELAESDRPELTAAGNCDFWWKRDAIWRKFPFIR
jgi:electron transfer flavoprotein alpha subunit